MQPEIIDIKSNFPLKKLNSWRVGGCAARYYKPRDLITLLETISLIEGDIYLLGLGSNVLIADNGINATVIHTLGALDNIAVTNDGSIKAEAGVTCAKLAKFCCKHDLNAGAFWAGIPGTVGGALAMNAGAFGGETWDYVSKVEVFNRKGELQLLDASEFEVGYRHVALPKDIFFAAAYFKLPRSQSKTNIKQLLHARSESQPIGKLSCGSVFKNPVGGYAAQLIEQAGLKGVKLGGAQVSTKHSNFILNLGNATAKDLKELICLVQKQVQQKFEIKLETEVKIIGEW